MKTGVPPDLDKDGNVVPGMDTGAATGKRGPGPRPQPGPAL